MRLRAPSACALAFVHLALAAPNQPMLQPISLESDMTLPGLQRHALALQEIADQSSNTRSTGTIGYNSSVSYFYDLLDQTGAYNLERRLHVQFPAGWDGASSFKFGSNETSLFWGSIYTPPTPEAGVTAPLVYLGEPDTPGAAGCAPSDYTNVDVSGKIVLVQTAGCLFSKKSRLARQAGASALIVYDDDGFPFKTTLGSFDDDAFVPTGAMPGAEGRAIIARLASGEQIVPTVKVSVTPVGELIWGHSVIATSKMGNQDNVVMLGAHLDSVEAGPGLNDNGSGSSLLAELALQLSKYSFTNAVRFAWWSGEEFGLEGSTAYVNTLPDDELEKIAMYLNFDMVASPNYVLAVFDGDGSAGGPSGPPGSAAIESAFIKYFTSKNLPTVPTSFGDANSDFVPFIAAGIDIPTGGLFTGAGGHKTVEQAALFGGQVDGAYDPNYHSPLDNYDNLNTEAWMINAKAVANVLGQFALSTDAVGAQEQGMQRIRPVTTHNDALLVPGPHPGHVEESR